MTYIKKLFHISTQFQNQSNPLIEKRSQFISVIPKESEEKRKKKRMKTMIWKENIYEREKIEFPLADEPLII